MGSRSAIHCIVPPIVLERIARNGNEHQRDWALSTMATDQSVRAARIQNLGKRTPGSNRRSTLDAHMRAGRPHRTIRDAREEESFTGVTVREEGDPATGDPAVDEAFDGFGGTYEFFWKQFGRDSIDDEGMHLEGIVHYGRNFDNAFWDGQRMVFGDGDGQLFNRFTRSLDVIAHELVHGVTEDEAALMYIGEPGALNESMSDVFGSMVKQYFLQQKVEDADWLIGSELLAEGVDGIALRSMKDPGSAYDDKILGKDPQPGHMDDYVRTTADNGGVHINSGIPNKAFYAVAKTLGGYSWERAGRIWYESLRSSRLQTKVRFSGFARITQDSAEHIYGPASHEALAVRSGWEEVGVVASP